MKALRSPFDVIARALIIAACLWVYGFTMYTVGAAQGARRERERTWRECVRTYEKATIALVRVNDPCKSRRR